MHKTYLLPLSLFTFTSVNADQAVDLPGYTVTATRTKTASDQLATASSVFTRADIEQFQVRSLPELLQRAPGVNLVNNGGMGKTTSLFMRGTNSDHVLVLIDGVKVGSVSLGTSPFQHMPIDQIERVEIIRGPQSSLYGSEAIGGVIQIFTRKGRQTEQPKFNVDLGGGSYDTVQAAATVSGKFKQFHYALSTSHINTQGFDARQATDGFFPIDQPDRDGYYNTGLNAKLGYQFENGEIEAFYSRADGRTDFDGFQIEAEFVNQVVGLHGSIDVNDFWRSSLRLGMSREDSSNFTDTGEFFSRFDSTRWNVSWLNEFTINPDHRVIFGADYRLDEIDSNTLYVESARYDVGVFAELNSRLWENHYLHAAVRWDENEAFGDYVTGSVGWRFNWNYGLSLFASYGTAFKSPSFNELYWPDDGFGGGNPNLDPEESETVEVGIAGQHDRWGWEIRAFHTMIDELIAAWPPQNVNKANIDGIELAINAEIMGWKNSLSGELLSGKDTMTNKRLPRRAEKLIRYDLSKSFDRLNVGMTVLARDAAYDDVANTAKIPGFVTVDLRAAYEINKNWRLNAKLSNLLNKQYQLVDTYNTADRNFFVSIHYQN